MGKIHSFLTNFNRKQAIEVIDLLVNGKRGRMLGREISDQLDNGYLTHKTYSRLSRWVNPKKSEPFVQPIALKLSMLLYGKKISRCS